MLAMSTPAPAPAAEDSPTRSESIVENADVAAPATPASGQWWDRPETASAAEAGTTPEPQPVGEPAPASAPESIDSSAAEAGSSDLTPATSGFGSAPPFAFESEPQPVPQVAATPPEPLPASDKTFFSGDSTFFSLDWALQTFVIKSRYEHPADLVQDYERYVKERFPAGSPARDRLLEFTLPAAA